MIGQDDRSELLAYECIKTLCLLDGMLSLFLHLHVEVTPFRKIQQQRGLRQRQPLRVLQHKLPLLETFTRTLDAIRPH